MTPSKLKERFARLGPVRGIDRVASGSPADLVLRPATDIAAIKTISVALALARRGMSLLQAKRAVEAVVEQGEAFVHVPTVEDLAALAGELGAAGIRASRLHDAVVDVKAVRTALGMTQEQFALRFGLEIDALRNWEQGRRQPDRATSSYLRVIASRPKEASAALEEELA